MSGLAWDQKRSQYVSECMIDFHSHILPGIDDGSRNIEMSRKMLQMSASQGIDIILATPHFYADQISLSHFLENREISLDSVEEIAENYGIKILTGAEVAFFSGMSRSKELQKLTISGTSLLLLEMPFRSWTHEDIWEVRNILRNGIQPVIAHIERFYACQKNDCIIEELLSLPLYIQINAEAFLSWKTRRRVLRIIQKKKVLLLGSDCHNISSRPPNLQQARAVIKNKLGEEYLKQIDFWGQKLIGKIE